MRGLDWCDKGTGLDGASKRGDLYENAGWVPSTLFSLRLLGVRTEEE